MWAATVIVRHPFAKYPSEMSLVDGDQPVQTLPTHRADQSFAKRVGLRRPRRGLEHMPPLRRDRPVDRCGKDAIPIVEDEPVGRLRGHDRPKLLNRPRSRGILGDVPMEDPTRTNLEDDEHIDDAKAAGDYGEEVTGHDRMRVIPHKRHPALRSSTAVPRTQTPNVTRRNCARSSRSFGSNVTQASSKNST
jgi:hypothetical protein